MRRRISSLIRARGDLVTLGVQGVVLDEASRVLLVRHGYRPGWHFPGGGVERGERFEEALERELIEETGVRILGEPRFIGIYTNFEAYPGDHILLFVADRWRREHVPEANVEIAEHGFFALDQLPPNLTPGAGRRLDELYGKSPQSTAW